MISSNSDFGGGQRRPSDPAPAFISGKEDPRMIAIPAESFDRFTDALERIAEIAEKAFGGKEEVKEEAAKRLLNPEEASKIMHLNVQTVTAWCRAGKIKGIKVGGNETNGKGGKWLIAREEIDHYLHRHQMIYGTKKGGAK